ncbi:RadC family protein [Butyrivibrio sp. AC2005]|uniref:RadC family protein n=1 Tax=Butyrivibrio sp. AC2005 TaxID=1280672 RepID=UPI00041A7D05|nr:DNA repair protein RadC [Butyrivibrio sp. AC2005]
MDNTKSINKMLKENDSYKNMLPYERFMTLGAGALTDGELLAIIIRTGTSSKTPMEIGNSILNLCERYGKGISGIRHLTLDDMLSVKGIGEVKAVKLMCIAELSDRIARSRAMKRLDFNNPETVADYYMEKMCNYQREHTVLACLNTQDQLICEYEISVGTVKAAALSPREIFIHAVKNHAVKIILLHNHPSGDPTPSYADLELTEQIRDAGNLLDIKLNDHIIIGDHRYYSFKENNIL